MMDTPTVDLQPPRIRAREVLLALGAYALVTLWYWWPMVVAPDAVWSVGRDFFQNSWNLWWVDRAFERGEPLLHTDRLFHPQGTSLAFHTLSLATSLPAWALMEVFGLSVGTAYAVVFLAAFPLSAMGAWLLARHLSGSAAAAFVVGVFFAFNPYHTAMVTQLNNVQFQWLPLAVLGVVRVLEGRGWGSVALAGIATGLCGYVDWYQPVFVVVAAALLVPAGLLRDGRLGDGATWLKLGAAGLLALLLALPGLMPMLALLRAGEGPSGLDSPIRYAGEVQLFGMRPKGTVALASWGVVFGWTTLLALAWIALRARRAIAPGWWLLAIAAFLLMQGARLTVLNDETAIPMPMAVFDKLPGLAFIRVPHRFLLLLLLAMAGILARGLAALEVRHGAKLVVGVGLLMAAEMQPAAPSAVELELPPVYAELEREVADFAVLELPLDFRDGYAMYLQTVHGKALTGGYTSHILPAALSGLRSDLMRALLPAVHDNDILDLPVHLPLRVDRVAEVTLQDWRHELVVKLGVRFIILHDRADFEAGEPLAPPDTLEQKLCYALMPFRFNPGINDLQGVARDRVADFRRQLMEESAQAEALVERLFGEPDAALGGARARVWDLRPWHAQLLAESAD